MATEAARRVVPGAPPPAPLTKTQKKKRRAVKKDGESEPDTPLTSSVVLPDTHAAALMEKAPEGKDVKSGAVAEELVVKLVEAPKSEAGDATGATKSSSVVELLSKRLRTVGKKITRIHIYSGKPYSELNDDQKKTLATLPSLEAVRKELEETKKAVETLEVEQAREAAQARTAAEEAERQRIAEGVAELQGAQAERTARILDFIRLHSLLSNADPSVQALNLVEAEINAIYTAVNALVVQEAELRHDVLRGFLYGEGEIEDGRLLEILDAHSRPPVQEEIPAVAEEVAEVVAGAVVEAEAEQEAVENIAPVVSGIPTATGGLSFQFVQESELEGDPVSFENRTERVEKEDSPQEPVSVSVEVKETYVAGETTGNGQTENAGSGALDWADDEGELPSIDGLHKTFGTSGSGTPADTSASPEQQADSAKRQSQANEATDGAPNGNVQAPPGNDDGFTQARGGRARGRGRGFRGGERGERGPFRGGERGGFRGGRGGRGRPNPANESNNWRSAPDGEQRGRGRGRGRGFDRDRGAAPRGGRGGGNEGHARETDKTGSI